MGALQIFALLAAVILYLKTNIPFVSTLIVIAVLIYRMFFRNKRSQNVKNKTVERTTSTHSENLTPAVRAMRDTIDEKEYDDKLLRAKITAKDITGNILKMVENQRGVRVELALGLVGSLAGYTTSFAMMHEVSSGRLKVQAPEVAIATLASGDNAMLGDYINRKMVAGEVVGDQDVSLWMLVAGKVLQLGGSLTVDINELYVRVLNSLGKSSFGVLQVDAKHHPGDMPQEFVRQLFPKFHSILQRYELPVNQYYLACALSAQELLELGKDVIDPDMASKIIMECAFPASMLDPRSHIGEVAA